MLRMPWITWGDRTGGGQSLRQGVAELIILGRNLLPFLEMTFVTDCWEKGECLGREHGRRIEGPGVAPGGGGQRARAWDPDQDPDQGLTQGFRAQPGNQAGGGGLPWATGRGEAREPGRAGRRSPGLGLRCWTGGAPGSRMPPPRVNVPR